MVQLFKFGIYQPTFLVIITGSLSFDHQIALQQQTVFCLNLCVEIMHSIRNINHPLTKAVRSFNKIQKKERLLTCWFHLYDAAFIGFLKALDTVNLHSNTFVNISLSFKSAARMSLVQCQLGL